VCPRFACAHDLLALYVRELTGAPAHPSRSSNWVYPSPQMFFNAMQRKGWTPKEVLLFLCGVSVLQLLEGAAAHARAHLSLNRPLHRRSPSMSVLMSRLLAGGYDGGCCYSQCRQ
jgi:hypothetical protein